MNNKINICFMSEEAIETLKVNQDVVTDNLKNNQDNSDWLKTIYSGKLYEEKKYKIPEFTLKTSDDGNYSKVDLENSIKLYESLKDLPRYILTDERFWAWINFEICYKACLQAMPIKSKSTFENHWLLTEGKRRGIFFGVMSRCYFRVDLTIDERLTDKYELTKFAIESPERFRNLTWRTNSSQKHIVLGALKAEKTIYERYKNDPQYGQILSKLEKGVDNIYTKVVLFLSLYGSVRLIDAVSEEDIYKEVYNEMERLMGINN
ncbi:MAG: DUF6339 family protein [Bacilli bacterium]